MRAEVVVVYGRLGLRYSNDDVILINTMKQLRLREKIRSGTVRPMILHTRVSSELYDRISYEAKDLGVSKGYLVSTVLDKYLERCCGDIVSENMDRWEVLLDGG